MSLMELSGRVHQKYWILYPSLRGELANLERKVVGDLPPRAFRPLDVKAQDLQIESDCRPNLAPNGYNLTKLSANGSIGTLKQRSGAYPLGGEGIQLKKDEHCFKVSIM